jgi:hypothetical protein
MGKQIEEIIQGVWIFSVHECPPFPLWRENKLCFRWRQHGAFSKDTDSMFSKPQ